jgi:hypothetical protein
MKRTLLVVALLGSTVVGVGTASAYDWTRRAAFTSEWKHQNARIAVGRQGRDLSRTEAASLLRRHAAIANLPYNSATKARLARLSKRIATLKTN